MDSQFDTCARCGRDLSDITKNEGENRLPCPDCGSTERTFFVTLEGKTSCSASMSTKSKDIAGYIKQESRQRDDICEKTGTPVVVSVDVDHRDPDKTLVTHTVHDKLTGFRLHKDQKIGKAKHRPKKS